MMPGKKYPLIISNTYKSDKGGTPGGVTETFHQKATCYFLTSLE